MLYISICSIAVVEINYEIQDLFLNSLRKSCDSQKFAYPEREEKYRVKIKVLLLQPTMDQKTIRSSILMSFDFYFSNFMCVRETFFFLQNKNVLIDILKRLYDIFIFKYFSSNPPPSSSYYICIYDKFR